MVRGRRKLWLMTLVLIVVPLSGIAVLLYGAGRLARGGRRVPPTDPYDEWLRLRDLLRAQRRRSGDDRVPS